MANKKNRRRTKRAKVFKGNQYVDSAGQNKEKNSDENTGRNGPKQPCTEQASDTPRRRARKEFLGSEDHFNILISFGILKSIVDGTSRCPECNESVSTSTNMARKHGCSLCIEIKCRSCSWKKEFFTSPVVEQPNSPGKSGFEINLRFVMAFREIGKGHEAMKTFCQCLNLPCAMAYNSYQAINEKLLVAYEKVAEESISSECAKIREKAGDVNAVADTTVAIDGTWQKRGFSSLNGAVVATSLNSKAVDYHVMTKYCKACATWESKKQSGDYETWKASHSCPINHKSSAGAMEAAGAVEIFRRSINRNKLRYVNYLGDGDTASFSKVQEAKPYGTDFKITKLECVGHVQKRLGTRLRKLRVSYKGKVLVDGKPLTGRGRLTDVAINTLQNFFGMAIRQNAGNLYPMKKAVAAVLFHCTDLQDAERHKFCPRTATSWCKWQRDTVNQTASYKPKVNLPVCIKDILEPIFKDLSTDDLLSKCLHGRTQNANESFNQILWNKCPKTVFVGRTSLELGVSSAVIAFNEGAKGLCKVLENLGIKEGKCTTLNHKSRDRKRKLAADHKKTENVKMRRKTLRAKKKGLLDAEKATEGGESYAKGEY